jgi:hypothetical protein
MRQAFGEGQRLGCEQGVAFGFGFLDRRLDVGMRAGAGREDGGEEGDAGEVHGNTGVRDDRSVVTP